MHRLFIAIDLPEPARELLVRTADRSMAGARWVPPGQLHLTLRFIGAADEALLGRIEHALAHIQTESFPVTVTAPGHFPTRGSPHVLWAGVRSSAPLARLQALVEQALNRVGIPREERPFSPHITLARLKGARPTDVAAFEVRHATLAATFTVPDFHLFASILDCSGATHSRLASYPLTPTAPAS